MVTNVVADPSPSFLSIRVADGAVAIAKRKEANALGGREQPGSAGSWDAIRLPPFDPHELLP